MFGKEIQMVDLRGQYQRLRGEIDPAMRSVVESGAFINGPAVSRFRDALAAYMGGIRAVTCGNGTDALRIALQALGLEPGDEVVMPSFNYVAAAEMAWASGLVPVLVDVDPLTFNLDPDRIEAAISPRTRAIVAVHLFGQCAPMGAILEIARRSGLFVVEDNAQSVGADYLFPDGSTRRAGTIGHIGTTSFVPSKPLACYGDGGALFTSDDRLAERARMIANHGQREKYHHELVGCNSRLDTLQAAVLEVKLRHIDAFAEARRRVAARYDEAFAGLPGVIVPEKVPYSTHVYHQYTLRIGGDRRDRVREALRQRGVPSMIYYPVPLHLQSAARGRCRIPAPLPVSERLCREVLSLPIHTEMGEEELAYIIESFKAVL